MLTHVQFILVTFNIYEIIITTYITRIEIIDDLRWQNYYELLYILNNSAFYIF